jgi:hypothetical protein
MAVWYNMCSFGLFFPFWYVWTEKNLATLVRSSMKSERIKKPAKMWNRMMMTRDVPTLILL